MEPRKKISPAKGHQHLKEIKSNAHELAYPTYIDKNINLDSLIRGKGEDNVNISVMIGYGSKLDERKNSIRAGNLKVEIHHGYMTNTVSKLMSVWPTTLGLLFYGYGASRHMGTSSLAEEESSPRNASLFDSDVKLINAEEWLMQADYAAKSTKPESRLAKFAITKRDQIKEVLINLLPEINDIRITEPTKERMKPRVEFKTPYGWIPLEGLSLGYKTMIAWMVDLASRLFDRYPDSPNPLAEPAIVLVDEIDLHMHPRWQREIMSYLSERFPNTQFIVTAHSPLVVQAASNANVVVLKREDDHVVIENNPISVHGWRLDQIMTSDLFGLESARSPKVEQLLKRRTELLSKARLRKVDKEELAGIEIELEELPTGETPEDIEAMRIIREAAKNLKRQEGGNDKDK
jgi:hypothetical protein